MILSATKWSQFGGSYRPMARLLNPVAAAALAMMIAVVPAKADSHDTFSGAQERAEKALREGIEGVMQAMELLLGSIPQYEMPEVLENGDIIIRRKHRKPGPEKRDRKKSPDADEKHTRAGEHRVHLTIGRVLPPTRAGLRPPPTVPTTL